MAVELLNTMAEGVQAMGRIVFDEETEEGAEASGTERHWMAMHRTGKRGKITPVPTTPGGGGTARLHFKINGGRKRDFSDAHLRTLAAEFVRYCLPADVSRMALELEGQDEPLSSRASEAATEGALLGANTFSKYLSRTNEDRPKALDAFALIGGDRDGMARGRAIGDSLVFARSLANEPGNILTPDTFVTVAERMAGLEGMTCEGYNERDITKFEMNALLAVGRGSPNSPRLLHLVYRPGGTPKSRVALVGKGVTFDSGGLSLKSRDGIKTMKFDKSGACVVLGAMRAASKLRLPLEIHGIAGLVENMPDGGAYRPDDIVRTMSGKTIEIESTDAEGRLVLADVLTFASRLEPDALIDIATLTYATKAALGSYTAALMCDDDDLSAALEAAAFRAGERLHRFKMDDELLRKGLKGSHADLRQTSPDGGGAIVGGMFLREFVESGVPWAHLDIAATGWYDKDFGIYSKGASAYSMLTLVEYLRAISEE